MSTLFVYLKKCMENVSKIKRQTFKGITKHHTDWKLNGKPQLETSRKSGSRGSWNKWTEDGKELHHVKFACCVPHFVELCEVILLLHIPKKWQTQCECLPAPCKTLHVFLKTTSSRMTAIKQILPFQRPSEQHHLASFDVVSVYGTEFSILKI